MKSAVFTLDSEVRRDTLLDIFPLKSFLVVTVLGLITFDENDDLILAREDFGFGWYKIVEQTDKSVQTRMTTGYIVSTITDPIFRCRLVATSPFHRQRKSYRLVKPEDPSWIPILPGVVENGKDPVFALTVETGDDIFLPGSTIGAKIWHYRFPKVRALLPEGGQK